VNLGALGERETCRVSLLVGAPSEQCKPVYCYYYAT